MTSLNKDGSPTIPLCKDCRWFVGGNGIGALASCATPKRKGDFDVVYGWVIKHSNPRQARHNNNDCGMVGNFYEPKPPEETPLPTPTRWQRFKGWFKYHDLHKRINTLLHRS